LKEEEDNCTTGRPNSQLSQEIDNVVWLS